MIDDGTELDAKLIGTDPRTDLAVLKVDADSSKFTYVDFADDCKVRVGDWVVAVGNPFGLGGTVTAGIVSARGRDIGAGPYDDFLQIDAAVNRGNSGGPAFNLNGEVVGVNTAIFSPSGGNVGIAFAIPASTAKRSRRSDLMTDGAVAARLARRRRSSRSRRRSPNSLGLAAAQGRAGVRRRRTTSPAKKAGIVAGDVITAVDGKDGRVAEGTRPHHRQHRARQAGRRDAVARRQGRDRQGRPRRTAEPGQAGVGAERRRRAGAGPEPITLAELGLTVAPAEDGKGVVVTDVDPDSDAADEGCRPAT